MTFVFVKHRKDGKYEIRFRAREREDYQRLRMGLYAYVPADMYKFDHKARTWLVEGKCKREIERWLATVIEDLNPTVEFFCERQDAWKEAVEESYRALHVTPGAPWEVIRGAYYGLVEHYGKSEGANDSTERAHVAYGRLRAVFEEGDSSDGK